MCTVHRYTSPRVRECRVKQTNSTIGSACQAATTPEGKELPALRALGGGGVPADATEDERLRWRSSQCKRCRGSVRQEALEAAVLGAVAKFLRRDLRSGHFERRLGRWIDAQLGAAGDDGVAKRADLEKRKANLVRMGVTASDPPPSGAGLRSSNAELAGLDAARDERPTEAALRRQAADMLARRRHVLQALASPLYARNVTDALTAYRPLIKEGLWDRDDRTVAVRLVLDHMASVEAAVVARRRRGNPDLSSGYNAPWRVRASRRAARQKH